MLTTSKIGSLLVLGGGHGTVCLPATNQPTSFIMSVQQRITAPSTVRESRGATITQDRAAGVLVSGVRSATATVTNPASRNETPQYQRTSKLIHVDVQTEPFEMKWINDDSTFKGLSKCQRRCTTCEYTNDSNIIKCNVKNKFLELLKMISTAMSKT